MIARSLLVSACLHLAVLVVGGIWYGTAEASDRTTPPELWFVPTESHPPLVVEVSAFEPIEVEPTEGELPLSPPVLTEKFDGIEAQPAREPRQRSLADRLWHVPLTEINPPAAETELVHEQTAAMPPLAPLSAYVPAEPRTDLNRPPEYPRTARQRGQEGTVRLRLGIDAEGSVVDVALLSPCRYPSLNRAAIEALRGWRYRPAMRAGVRTEDTIVETIVFQIRE